MGKETKEIAVRPTEKLKRALEVISVREQFENALGDVKQSRNFIAGLVELYIGDRNMQECNPNLFIGEALKAATLNLPISKQLGQAWIIPYNGIPSFQLGYKGWIQIAYRSNFYEDIHAIPIREGQIVDYDYETGRVKIHGIPTSKVEIGYYAYFKLTNSVKKALYWPKDEMNAFATRYSPSYTGKNKAKSRWFLDYSSMAIKTMIKQLISHWGPVSIEMALAFKYDSDNETVDEVSAPCCVQETIETPEEVKVEVSKPVEAEFEPVQETEDAPY